MYSSVMNFIILLISGVGLECGWGKFLAYFQERKRSIVELMFMHKRGAWDHRCRSLDTCLWFFEHVLSCVLCMHLSLLSGYSVNDFCTVRLSKIWEKIETVVVLSYIAKRDISCIFQLRSVKQSTVYRTHSVFSAVILLVRHLERHPAYM